MFLSILGNKTPRFNSENCYIVKLFTLTLVLNTFPPPVHSASLWQLFSTADLQICFVALFKAEIHSLK